VIDVAQMSIEDLSRLTLRQLRYKASDLSIPLYSRKTKAELVKTISSFLEKKKIEKEFSSKKVIKQYAYLDNTSDKMDNQTTKVAFLPRDPEWAYVYWEISDIDREKAQTLGANKLCLRLSDVSGVSGDAVNPATLREVTVDSFSTEWYLPIPVCDRDYKVELGYKYGLNWMSLAVSSVARVPTSHPSGQILDQFVPFNLDSVDQTNSAIRDNNDDDTSGLHERLYQEATNSLRRRRVGSEEFMENNSPDTSKLNASGSGLWESGHNESGSGRLPSFWLAADAELIIYGSTDPKAKLSIGNEEVPLAPDGTFRLQVPFRDGNQIYDIKAEDSSGKNKRDITMKFDRQTPRDNSNPKDLSKLEWF